LEWEKTLTLIVGWECINRRVKWAKASYNRAIQGNPNRYSNTPTVTTLPVQMLRLDRNSVKTLDGSPLVKMLVNCEVVRT
jgi:hypothetical protein